MTPERVVVGRVGRAHGLDGSFFVEDPSEDARWFKVGSKLLAGGGEVEVVVSKHGSGRRPVIKVEPNVERGAALEVAREALAPPGEDEYDISDLVGLEVVEEGGRALGPVKAVTQGVANDAIELDNGELLPLVAACILSVDLENRRILIAAGFSGSE